MIDFEFEENKVYSRLMEQVLSARSVCSLGIMTLQPHPKIIASNLPCDDAPNISALENDELNSIINHAYLHTDKIFLTEIDQKIWGFSASIFPSSTFVVFFKFEPDASVIFGLLKNSKFREMFVLSSKIKAHPARKAERVREYEREFSCFCEAICGCLCNLKRFEECGDAEEIRRESCRLIRGLSLLVGCPISLSVEKRDDAQTVAAERTDIPLLTAFMIVVLCFARVNARNRSADIVVRESRFAPSVIVNVELYETEPLLKEFLSFEEVASEKKMPFGVCIDGKSVMIGFQPHAIEFSYMGIKSPEDWSLFFN